MQHALVLGAVLERRPQRGWRVGIDRLDLEVAPLAGQL